MIGLLRLLLPALIPSWRFFDRIGPAPRIEFAITATKDDRNPQWREVRPRPHRGSVGKMLVHLFWNRRRNEALYLVSCAERLVEDPTEWRAVELWQRAADMVRDEARRARQAAVANSDAGLAADPGGARNAWHGGRHTSPPWLRVRIIESMRDGSRMEHDVVYESAAHPFADAFTGASK